MTDRESMSASPDCGGDAAAYALGALEPHEAEAFRAHVQRCAVCRDELEALGGVVQALPIAARQYEAPHGLRRRVMEEVHREQAPAGRAGATPRQLWRGPRALLAGLTAAVVSAGGVLAGVELSAGAAATVIQARVSGIAGSAQLLLTRGHAELVVRNLTAPGDGHVYEVWLKSGKASPVPASVLFDVNASGNADVGIPRRIRGVSAVMVTQEPLGGTARPTHAPVIVARIA